MKRTQIMLRTSGGRDLAVDSIEKTYIAGSKYLVDTDYIRKSKSISCYTFTFFMMFLVAFFGAFAWLSVNKYNQVYGG